MNVCEYTSMHVCMSIVSACVHALCECMCVVCVRVMGV